MAAYQMNAPQVSSRALPSIPPLAGQSPPMAALPLLRLALFILSGLMALYGARDRRPVLALYWAGVAVYWLLYFVVS